MTENKIDAKLMVDSFFDAEQLAFEVNEVIKRYRVTPLTMAFAFGILERGINAQVPNWPLLRKLTLRALKEMEEAGIVPGFNADGSINTEKMESTRGKA